MYAYRKTVERSPDHCCNVKEKLHSLFIVEVNATANEIKY
jgi:hypothetical protein